MRKPIIAGNWKMHKNISESKDFVERLISILADNTAVEVVLCPPFTSLWHVAQECAGSSISVGAQNLFWAEKGSFTGEISPLMLREAGASYCIIGHSERRELFSETDEDINMKVISALENNIKPILCVGETLDEREKGLTYKACENQVRKALKGIEADEMNQVVLAYEPVWAIGTGRNADSGEVQEVVSSIRDTIASLFNADLSQKVRIQYGGSVKPDNIASFMKERDIDGALVGGASLDPDLFNQLINNST